MKLKELAQIIQCHSATVRVYLCRPEFNHVKVCRGIVENISFEDIEKIKGFYRPSNKRKILTIK